MLSMQDLTILIKPASSLCNMRCDYCFYADVSHHREIKSYGIMKREILDTLIRRAFAFAERSISFVFQGGEPMIAGLDFFKTAVEYQRKYNSRGLRIYNTIQTNATLIDEEFAAFFKENKFLVGVSLDGDMALHDLHRRMIDGGGSFARVLSGINLLKRHKVDFNILSVISKDSAKAPKEVYKALKEYGYLQFIPLIDDFGGESDFSLCAEDYGRFLSEVFELYYEDILKGNYVSVRDFDSYINMLRGLPPSSCAMQGMCRGYFTVEADGSVYPCDFYVTDEYKIGNIVDSSFFTLVKSERLRDFAEGSRSRHEKCAKCKWLSLCRGGCRRHREPFPSLNKFCESYSYFFDRCYDKMICIEEMLKNSAR